MWVMHEKVRSSGPVQGIKAVSKATQITSVKVHAV
jgi:hypothetical protein